MQSLTWVSAAPLERIAADLPDAFAPDTRVVFTSFASLLRAVA